MARSDPNPVTALHPQGVVFFDMGGTLLHPFPSFHAIVAAGCQEAGLDVSASQAEQAEAAVWARIAERDDRGRGISTSADTSRAFWIWVYETFLTEMGHTTAAATDLPTRLLDRFLLLDNYRLYDDALPVLDALRAAQVRLGVISNWEAWLHDLMGHLDITKYFEVVVVSGTTGVEKPEPAIFHHALRSAGVQPDRAVHIGDSVRDDAHGASAVGIRPILIDRSTPWFPGLPGVRATEPDPFTRISSLAELLPLLGIVP